MSINQLGARLATKGRDRSGLSDAVNGLIAGSNPSHLLTLVGLLQNLGCDVATYTIAYSSDNAGEGPSLLLQACTVLYTGA